MEKAHEELDPLFKEAILGNEEIVPFPTQRNEPQPQEMGNRSDGRGCISSPGQDFQPHIQMAAKFTVVALDLRLFDPGFLKSPVKEKTGAGPYWAIGNSYPRPTQIRDTFYLFWVSLGHQKALFSFAEIHQDRQCFLEFLKGKLEVILLFIFLEEMT
jgi:hypothetical protein